MAVETRCGQVLRDFREQRNLKQMAVGADTGYTRTWVSGVESGRLQGNPEAFIQLGDKHHEGDLIRTGARMVTQGAYVGPALDGDNVDQDRNAVLNKAEEEALELVEAIRKIRRVWSKPPTAWTVAEAQMSDTLADQAIDNERASEQLVTIIGRQRQVSPVRYYHKHDHKLADRGYTKEIVE